MNVRLISLTFGVAVLVLTSAFAGQPFGRDSVYAAPGGSAGTPSKAVTATTVYGRSSVYAYDLPAPTPKDQVRIVVTIKPGRV